MPLEATLINSSRIVIPEFFMLAEVLLGEKFMLMGKNLLVPGAEVAHDLVVHAFDMAMQVRPPKACNVAARVGAIVAQEENGISVYV